MINENEELHDLLQSCFLRPHTERPTVAQLMNHQFFEGFISEAN